MTDRQIPIISIIGWHNVGKTTFVTQLIAELKRRGLRVATIKHTRGDFQLDHEGTDTWRYAQAGSDVVVISGHGRLALLEQAFLQPQGELSLMEIVARLPSHLDLIITEGYKEADTPKIEIVPSCHETQRISGVGELLAQVVGLADVGRPEQGGPRHGAARAPDKSAGAVPPGTPCFQLSEVGAVVDLFVARGLVAPVKS